MIQLVPADIYLDTSVVVAAIVPGVPDSAASGQFCARLGSQRSNVYFSHLVRIEFAQALRNLVTRRQLPAQIRHRFQLDLWETNVLIRQRWFTEGTRRFDAFLEQFGEWFEIDSQHRIWQRGLEIMAVHQLRAVDAIHVATAQEIGVLDFATADDHFRRVPDLRLWLLRDPTAS